MKNLKLAAGLALVLTSALCAAQISGAPRSDDPKPQPDTSQTQTQTQMHEAESALELQDYKTAETKLKALVAASPENAKDGRILYDLGFAEERNGEDADAAKAYAASAAALPGFAEPQVALGQMDARAGRTEAARTELQAATKIETAAPALRAQALRALVRLDETTHPDAAQEELLLALKLTPETPSDVLLGAELAERAGDPADAETAYKRALTLLPGDVNATAGLVHVLQQQEKLAEADAVLTPALKDHADDPRLVAQAASLYAAEGKAKDAIPLLEQLRANDSAMAADPKVTRMLASLYAVVGDDAAAMKLETQLVAVMPNDPTLLDDLSTAQVRLMHYAEAEATSLKAVAMRSGFRDDQDWALAETHLAFAASKNHDPQTTLAALAARATVLPNTASSLFLEATARDTLRQRKEAILAYKAFLAAAAGKFPDEEFEARHRLIALENVK